jgi:hypothetical protein
MKNIDRYILVTFFLVGSLSGFTQSDNCASATALTIDNPLLCNQVMGPMTAQADECLTNWAGAGNATAWYSFTASNDSLVLNSIATAGSGYFIRVFGPGPVCQPSCASAIYSAQQTGDPGEHILITGLIPGQTYFIQIDASEPNGPAETALVLCLSVNNPDPAGLLASPLLIDACGSAFSNSTNGGYWQSGSGTRFADFDGVAGDDMPFIGNNTSWSTFCSLTAGTWQITVSGVSNCTLPAPNQGIQGSVFTGTPAALTNKGNSQNPIPPGGSWTSPIITVNAGDCAYLAIDGFAGDACDYTVTLTNLTGGCVVVLPITLLGFNAIINENYLVEINWTTTSEINNNYFTIERSNDLKNFEVIDVVKSKNGNSNVTQSYNLMDRNPIKGTSYYRLKQTDYDGQYEYFAPVAVTVKSTYDDVTVYPNPVTGNGYLTFSSLKDDEQTVVIYDVAGRLVYQKQYTITTGNNKLTLETINLTKGMYFIKMDNAEDGINLKFIKE